MSERCGPDSDSMLCYDRVASESASKNRGCYLTDAPVFPARSVRLSTIGPTSFGSAPPEAEADDGTAAEEDELLLGLSTRSGAAWAWVRAGGVWRWSVCLL